MKKIAILGSTGSIGKNALHVVRHLKEDFKVMALAAKENIDELERQAKEFQPELIAVFESSQALELKKRLPTIEVLSGIEGLKAVASYSSVEFVVSAIAGTLGLIPTVSAIEAQKNIGLANKEALVSGGSYVMSLVKKYGVDLLPIDSEHSAIFQCLLAGKKTEVSRLILTSSGGPFRNFSSKQLDSITVEQALAHPTWKMGPKVTIDSSTLMNKGLEVIEAYWLFNLPLDKIEVIIHPQSIIHSMVEYQDQSIMAQMGEPNMIVPIQYAMTYPHRKIGSLKPFDFLKNSTLQFLLPDFGRFRCLSLAYESIRRGDSFPCYMNAANEILVNRFLNREISWKEIPQKLETLMMKHQPVKVDNLEAILAIDAIARAEAKRIL